MLFDALPVGRAQGERAAALIEWMPGEGARLSKAPASADLSVNILEDQDLSGDWINGAVDNHVMEVPAAFLGIENVTADNVGIYFREEICQGAEDAPVCAETTCERAGAPAGAGHPREE